MGLCLGSCGLLVFLSWVFEVLVWQAPHFISSDSSRALFPHLPVLFGLLSVLSSLFAQIECRLNFLWELLGGVADGGVADGGYWLSVCAHVYVCACVTGLTQSGLSVVTDQRSRPLNFVPDLKCPCNLPLVSEM